VQAMVDVLDRQSVCIGETEVGQEGGEDDEQGDNAGDGRVLELAGVAPVQSLQLVVLEAVAIEEA